MAAVRAGSTLCLRGGEYLENVSIVPPRGTPTARITMRSFPGERAVLRGLQRITDPDYWTFSDLGFTWNTGTYDQHMVKFTAGTGWVIEYSEFWGARSFADLLIANSASYGAPTGWTLRTSYLRDTIGGELDDARSHNLYLNAPGSTGGLIERNVFANAPMGYNLKVAGSHEGTDGTDNVTVRYNTFLNGHQANLVLGNLADNNVLYRNIFVANDRGWAVRLYDLRGTGNRLTDNLWWDAAGGTFCLDYYSTVLCPAVMGSGQVQANPLLDSTYHPQNAVAQGYGRFGL